MQLVGSMPAIQHLMKRFGFVRLDRYGLLLTPEGRIISLRPEVLDDGAGSKVVGWEEGDLAAMELEKWEPARPAPKRAVASRVATPPARPVISAIPVAARPRPAPAVAPPPQVDEDEWEWEIALARARVAAEEVQVAVVAAPPAPSLPRVIQPQPVTQAVIAPPTKPTLPMAVVADPMTSGTWPKTEPVGNIDYEDYTSPTQVMAREPVRPAVTIVAVPAPAPRLSRPGTSPATVIPVPRLPSLRDGGRVDPMAHAMPPRRFPKGTTRIDPSQLGSDETRPGIVMPAPARSVALPSIKRTASRG